LIRAWNFIGRKVSTRPSSDFVQFVEAVLVSTGWSDSGIPNAVANAVKDLRNRAKKKLREKKPLFDRPTTTPPLLENAGTIAEFLMKFDTRLDTRQASAFLAERGYKTAPATLNKKRCVGGGPEFELFGRRPLYTEKALLEWVQARTTPLLR